MKKKIVIVALVSAVVFLSAAAWFAYSRVGTVGKNSMDAVLADLDKSDCDYEVDAYLIDRRYSLVSTAAKSCFDADFTALYAKDPAKPLCIISYAWGGIECADNKFEQNFVVMVKNLKEEDLGLGEGRVQRVRADIRR
jgi:hypothetical protein